MPGFHRPPEWQQPADRHTRLIDPVLTVRQLSRFEMSLKHVVRIDHALVFSTPKGGYEAYLPPRRPTRGEIAGRRYTAVYEVDMGVHPFTDTLTLPSDNDAFEFTAETDLSWQVLDPARFVASGVRDVPAMLLGELQQAARPVTRRFPIGDSAAAERELLHAVTVLGPLGAPAGLQVTWTLRLRRDLAGIEHQQRLRAIDHSAAEQIRAARQGMQVDVETDHRHRQQDALQLTRAMEYGRGEQDLALQQQHWQHERALLQGQQALELQRLEAQKIEFYQWHLAQGGVHAWALHLAQHPEDSRLVMNSMREDQLRMIQAQMDLVKELLNGENAEKFELEGPKQLALRTVSDILTQRLPGVPHAAPLLTPPGDAEDVPPAAHPQAPPRTPATAPQAVTAADPAPARPSAPGHGPGTHGPDGVDGTAGTAGTASVNGTAGVASVNGAAGVADVADVAGAHPGLPPQHPTPGTPAGAATGPGPAPGRSVTPHTPSHPAYASAQAPYAHPQTPHTHQQPPYPPPARMPAAPPHTAYAPPETPGTPPHTAPGTPLPPPHTPYAPPGTPGTPPVVPAPLAYGPPTPAAPPAPWQPPPGYGRTPTAPPRQPSATPAAAGEEPEGSAPTARTGGGAAGDAAP
ncbi:hypothetical protein ACIF8T_18720 [Streptomyces sp. NPDC085946]|uniref:hypothetical protein n=1 Tax=Streptomyces sp. NPDC085946 TaxID=3365744 RepID=UPI0037D4EC53